MTNPNAIVPVHRANFDVLVSETLLQRAESSARQYQHVYDLWADYCSNQRIDFLELTPVNVLRFLEAHPTSITTRKFYMSAMRQLLLTYATADPIRGAQLQSALKLVKRIPRGNLSEVERDKRALTPSEVEKVLNAWNGDSLLHQRNAAMIALLFLTGIRRAELAALKWSDLNLEAYTINVRHGKGDKERDVAIAGEQAIRNLKDWRAALPDRVYVFPSFDQRQQPGDDTPTDGQTVFRVVKRTEKLSGVKFSPHTARRTFITEGLLQGATLSAMQAQAGHSRGETTLTYARPVDAQQRRREFRHRYGD